MSEASSPTQKLYVKMAALLVGVNQWIALDTGDMSAFDATTNALASETAASGLARAAATVTQETTTVTGDTNQAYKSFSALASATITGAGLFSAASVGDMWNWHRWAGSVAAQNGDTINETMKTKMEIGA